MILENKDLDKFAEMIIKSFEHSLRVSEELKKKTNEELAYLLKITIAAETGIFSNFEALLHEVIDRLEKVNKFKKAQIEEAVQKERIRLSKWIDMLTEAHPKHSIVLREIAESIEKNRLSRKIQINTEQANQNFGIGGDEGLPLNYTYEELVKRAIRNAVPHIAGEAERWVAVMDTFATGSTVAIELCKYFELDPNEKVHGVNCIACNP
jgi:SHS2 domain-containing protein